MTTIPLTGKHKDSWSNGFHWKMIFPLTKIRRGAIAPINHPHFARTPPFFNGPYIGLIYGIGTFNKSDPGSWPLILWPIF